ncbi:MAG: ribbon-helix-helix domain-containing protein [Janthinobacterium lividum]
MRTIRALAKRSFTLAGHRTSVALEPEFWAALSAMAQGRRQTLSSLIADVDAARDPNRPLASSLRVLALTGATSPAQEAARV